MTTFCFCFTGVYCQLQKGITKHDVDNSDKEETASEVQGLEGKCSGSEFALSPMKQVLDEHLGKKPKRLAVVQKGRKLQQKKGGQDYEATGSAMRASKRKASMKLLKKTNKKFCHRNKDCGKNDEDAPQDSTNIDGSDHDYTPEDSTSTNGSENLD